MVLRKNLPEGALVPAPLSQATNNPPYPLTPADERPPQLPTSFAQQEEVYSPNLNESPAFNLKPVEEAQKQKVAHDDDSDYSDNEWDQSDDEATPEDLPGALKIGGGKSLPASSSKGTALPDALRAGPPPGMTIKKSMESLTPEPTGATSSSWGAASNGSAGSAPLKTNNPYLNKQYTGQNNYGAESSQSVWGDAQSQPQTYGELAELPSFQTPTPPTNHIASLTLDSQVPPVKSSQSPEQPPLISVESATPQSAHPRQESTASDVHDPGMDVSSLDAFARNYGLPEDHREQDSPQRTWLEQQGWEQSEKERQQRELAAAHDVATSREQERLHAEEYHRLEQASQSAPSAPLPFHEETGPPLPPRRSQEQPLTMPPHVLNTSNGSATVGPESANTAMDRQRKEHYQIKHIRWHDVNKQGIRTSPILTQNLNGPCPLLALVNALVLSTPAGIETALVETLRTREQVSLGLLLDAVFDELMSGRRGGAAQELPDVDDLYKFLLALHTGLNVNPMFVPDLDATDGTSALNPSLAARAGGFEKSRDMKLYRTFDIPLLHGWLPEPGSDAYGAFERIAKSYETSQYVQFQEEELDAKLQTGEALTTDEQQMFTDIHAIKEFLNNWPTQLTTIGLKTMRDGLQSGQVAILFRNDHFSTLYKDPRTNQLVTLVTDQGYSTHDEIVWESLIDVNGQGSELYSGDFRPVGNNSTPQRQPDLQPAQSRLDVGDNEGWTTVQSRRGDQQRPSTPNLSQSPNPTPVSPVTDSAREQEDHDLALALQLQEEEDDRHRRSQDERRRRENQLSEDAISAQSQARPGNRRTSRAGETPPTIPPRRNNVQTTRPNNEPAPPPTYEEASTNPPYHPPQGHPASSGAPLTPVGSAYRQTSGGGPRPPHLVPQVRRNSRPTTQAPAMAGGRLGRRQSAGVVPTHGNDERGDKCVVM